MSNVDNQDFSKTEDKPETERLVQKYIEDGGIITICKPNDVTPDIKHTYGWGKRKPQEKKKE